jgi:hypothetical protein
VPKDPVTSGNAEAGVFAYVQAYAARGGSMSRSVDEAWTGSWSITAGEQASATPSVRLREARPKASDARSPSNPHQVHR